VVDETEFVYWPESPDEPAETLDDIDRFLDRMREATGETRRRMRVPGARTSPPPRSANDRPEAPPKIEIVLYTSAASAKSQKALRAIQNVLENYVAAQVKFSTCDLARRPEDGEADSVVFTPTLVKQGPGPRTSIIGNLDQEDILKDLLDASGDDRRRWDD
jgi:circadian clock protein KaiB